jgi:hypothetical protein
MLDDQGAALRAVRPGATITGMTVIATLTVVRPRGSWTDRVRAYQIVVDGAVKGSLRAGAEMSLALPPGAHTVQARSGRTASPDVPVHLGPGATVRLCAEPGDGGHAPGRRRLHLTPVG